MMLQVNDQFELSKLSKVSKSAHFSNTVLASDFQHIIAGEIVFTDSIPSRAEKMYLNKFIRMLPGVYEHTRYIYATDDLSYIYYGPMDRE